MVFRVVDEHSDIVALSARCDFGPENYVNTLVPRYKRDGVEDYAAVVNLGLRRLGVNDAIGAPFGAYRLSFTAREIATGLTDMQFGGTIVLSLPEGMPLLVDTTVLERPSAVIDVGVREIKLLLSPALLKGLSGVVVAELSEAGRTRHGAPPP